jgi:hypothetical protein
MTRKDLALILSKREATTSEANRIAYETGQETPRGQNVAFLQMQQSHQHGPC